MNKFNAYCLKRYLPVRSLLLNKYSPAFITCLLLCLFLLLHGTHLVEGEKPRPNSIIPDHPPSCLPDSFWLETIARQEGPWDMFHRRQFDREIPIVLLSAYESDNNILVTLQNDGYMGARIYCHYRNEKSENLGYPIPGFVYPQFVVNCCRREGAKYMSVTPKETDTTEKYVPLLSRAGSKPKYTLSMCLSPLYGSSPQWLLLAELIEHSKLHGVEHFYVYIQELDAYSRRLLDSYISSGDAEVIDLSEEIARNGEVWQQDCASRSRYESKYVVFQDVDERFTAMTEKLNLREYVTDFFPKREDVAVLVFRQLWIIRDQQPPSIYAGDLLLRQHLPTLAFQNTSAVTAKGHYAKNVVDPLKIISMGVHWPYDMYPGHQKYYVPPELFTIRHYRTVLDNDWLEKTYPRTLEYGDYRITHYAPWLQARLVANVKTKLDQVYSQ